MLPARVIILVKRLFGRVIFDIFKVHPMSRWKGSDHIEAVLAAGDAWRETALMA